MLRKKQKKKTLVETCAAHVQLVNIYRYVCIIIIIICVCYLLTVNGLFFFFWITITATADSKSFSIFLPCATLGIRQVWKQYRK